MAVCRSLLLLAFATCVLSEGETGVMIFMSKIIAKMHIGVLFEPCKKNDIKCVSTAIQTFMEKTSNGLPDYNIKPLDPLIIPELNVVVDEVMGLVFQFKNINITGLKNQEISDFQIDTDKKSVVLKTKAVLNIVGDVKIEFTKKNKVFNGPYTASTTALGISQYGFSLTKKGDNEYFEVGPETNTCEIIGEPNVAIGDVLQNALNNDSDAKAMKPDYETNKVALRKKTLCRIVETAYITVIHNIRASGKVFPKSAFFIDI